MDITNYANLSPLFALGDTFVLSKPGWLILVAAGLAVAMFGEAVRRARARQQRWERRINRGSRLIRPSGVQRVVPADQEPSSPRETASTTGTATPSL